MAKQKLEAELTLDNKSFIAGLGEATGSIGKFGKFMGEMTLALGAAAGAFAVIVKWMKDTEWGANAMNTTLSVSKQLLQSVMTGQTMNWRETIKLSEEKNRIINKESKELYEVAKRQRELNLLVVSAADQTKTLTERKELYNEALKKEQELKNYLLTEAQEELEAAHREWQMNIGNIDAKNEYYKIAAKIQNIMGMDSRRIMSQYTGLLE